MDAPDGRTPEPDSKRERLRAELRKRTNQLRLRSKSAIQSLDARLPAALPRRTVLFGGLAVVAGGGATLLLRSCVRSRSGGAGDGKSGDAQDASVLPTVPAQEPIVRVRLAKLRGGVARTRVGSRGQKLVVHRDADRDGAFDLLDGPVDARRRGTGWRLRDARGVIVDAPNGVVRFAARDDDGDAPFLVDGLPVRGAIVIRLRDNGADVINHVGIESYLPGVLAAELYSHWNPATFRAQAIVSRSFATFEHLWFRDRRDFELESTERSQVYAGDTVDPAVRAAVAATRGQVITWKDGLVPGYFSSTCGGRAAAARDVIGPNPANAIPPLDGHTLETCCEASPRFRWSRERALADVARRLEGYAIDRRESEPDKSPAGGEGPKRLTAINVGSRNPHGRPVTYVVEGGPADGMEIEAATFRRLLDARAPGQSKRPSPLLSSSDFGATVKPGGRMITFDGSGFGHGAGMCQFGAEAKALAGWGHERIVTAYFPGATITRAWGGEQLG